MSHIQSQTRVGMSFPKNSRILKKLEYKRVLDFGCKVVGQDLVVFAAKARLPRLGLIVSRKVGNAVTRNRVKRLLKEAFRQHLHLKSWDIVVIARRNTANADFSQVRQSLVLCLERLRKKLELMQKQEPGK